MTDARTTHSPEEILRSIPPSPWELERGYVTKQRIFALIMIVVAALAAWGAGWFVMTENRKLSEEQAIWDAPDSVQAFAQVDGYVTTEWFVFENYDLELTYIVEATGETKTVPLEFDLLFSSPDLPGRAEIRYDPDDPSRIATRDAVELIGKRRTNHLVMTGVLFLLFGVGSGLLGWSQLRKARDAIRLAERGVPIAAALEAAEPVHVKGRPTGNFECKVRMPPEYGGRKRSSVVKGPPVFLDDGGTVLVLIDPQNHGAFVLPPRDLRPFLFPVDAVAKLQQQLPTQPG